MPEIESPKLPLVLEREYVRCGLCGEDDTVVEFEVKTQDLKLSSLWVGDIEYPVAERETIVRCRSCGLVYVNPRLAPMAEVAAYNPALEMQYFETTRSARAEAYRRLIDQIPGWLGRAPTSLLDMGCGDGLLLEVARHSGIESRGVEISEELIRMIRERLGEDAVMDANDVRSSEACYDVISLINVLEHLREPAEIITQVVRALKPDGILLVHVPNLGGLPARLLGRRWHQIEPYAHFYYFDYRTLGDMLRKAGALAFGRFSLVVSKGVRRSLQELLNRVGFYMDNGLGVVARKDFR